MPQMRLICQLNGFHNPAIVYTYGGAWRAMEGRAQSYAVRRELLRLPVDDFVDDEGHSHDHDTAHGVGEIEVRGQ